MVTYTSVPTSGEGSGDDVAGSASRMCRRVIYRINCLKPTRGGACKHSACVRADLMFGDILVAQNGNMASREEGRIEAGMRKRSYELYM